MMPEPSPEPVDPVTWIEQAQRWVEVGAGTVVFCPLPTDPVELPL